MTGAEIAGVMGEGKSKRCLRGERRRYQRQHRLYEEMSTGLSAGGDSKHDQRGRPLVSPEATTTTTTTTTAATATTTRITALAANATCHRLAGIIN